MAGYKPLGKVLRVSSCMGPHHTDVGSWCKEMLTEYRWIVIFLAIFIAFMFVKKMASKYCCLSVLILT